jgi:hypothetical protein
MMEDGRKRGDGGQDGEEEEKESGEGETGEGKGERGEGERELNACTFDMCGFF